MVISRIYKLLKQEWASQFLTFCMVGLLGVAMNFLTFSLLLNVLNVHYLVASGVGFTLPVFVLFFLNKKFTFKLSGKKGATGMLIKYFLVCTFSFFLDQLSMFVQVGVLNMNQHFAKLIAMAITTVSNFIGSKFLAFRRV